MAYMWLERGPRTRRDRNSRIQEFPAPGMVEAIVICFRRGMTGESEKAIRQSLIVKAIL